MPRLDRPNRQECVVNQQTRNPRRVGKSSEARLNGGFRLDVATTPRGPILCRPRMLIYRGPKLL
jgi:hypothetical protein